VSTGVSAQDRITTIEAALRSSAAAAYRQPGHVFRCAPATAAC
jgi:3,4-dihydroxy-2-butanone 4-phosphate synthase